MPLGDRGVSGVESLFERRQALVAIVHGGAKLGNGALQRLDLTVAAGQHLDLTVAAGQHRFPLIHPLVERRLSLRQPGAGHARHVDEQAVEDALIDGDHLQEEVEGSRREAGDGTEQGMKTAEGRHRCADADDALRLIEQELFLMEVGGEDDGSGSHVLRRVGRAERRADARHELFGVDACLGRCRHPFTPARIRRPRSRRAAGETPLRPARARCRRSDTATPGTTWKTSGLVPPVEVLLDVRRVGVHGDADRVAFRRRR